MYETYLLYIFRFLLKIILTIKKLESILYKKTYIHYNNNEGKDINYMKNKKMKLARIEKDLTQEDLAKIVGVTRQTIGLIEVNKFNPSLKLCISICKALEKTLDQIFWEDDQDE